MRFRLLALPAFVTVAALVACSSGGSSSIPASGGGSSSNTAGGTPTGSASASVPANDPTSTSITTSSGLSITIPPNTFATATTVTAYQYASASGLPAAAQLQNKRAGAQSRSRALSVMPAGGTFLAGFAIDGGGANPYQAIGVTEAFTGTVPAGDVVRVAKLGANGYTDVDTATVVGSNVSNNKSAQYVSVSVGGTAAPYIFYAIAAPAAPAAITISVQPNPAGSALSAGSTQQFLANGSDANGNYLPFTAVFAITPSTMGTVVPSLTPNLGTIMAGAALGAASVTATDPRTSTVGTYATSVLTERPGTGGDTFSFNGTLTRKDVYTYPQGNPLPTTVQTATVSQAVTVTTTPNPIATGGNASEFVTIETDTYPTRTNATETTAFYSALPLAAVPGPMQLYGFLTEDSANNEYITEPATPDTVDELPEVSGASWQNSPAGIYEYQGVDGDFINQATIADGSYQALEVVGGITGFEWFTKADFSGDYQNLFIQGSNEEVEFAYSAPSGGQISIQQNVYAVGASPVPSPASPPLVIQNWIPSGAALYSDNTVDDGPAAIPNGASACQIPSSITGTGNKLVETTTTIDPVLGTITTLNTTQYVIPGFGPACVQVQSETKEFYDYNIDVGDYLAFFGGGSTPLQDTTISETLNLSAATGSDVAASSVRRGQASSTMSTLHAITPGAIRNARNQIEVMNQADRIARVNAFKAHIARYITTHGKGVLK